MMTPRVQKATREARAGPRTCKTCTPCRQKKVKCDGTRPHCQECQANGLTCIYPQDARRDPRPSRARVQSLEAAVAAMFEHMKTSGIVPSHAQLGDWLPETVGTSEQHEAIDSGTGDHEPFQTSEGNRQSYHSSARAVGSLESHSTHGGIQGNNFAGLAALGNAAKLSQDLALLKPRGGPIPHDDLDWQGQEPTGASNALINTSPLHQNSEHLSTPVSSQPFSHLDSKDESGLSPCEARVAGVFHEHGCVKSVHGLASIMNPSSQAQHNENISKMKWKGERAISASKARLISNAALQRQRESRIFQQPMSTIDLDGCEPELAKHLFDIHFNRQHYAYLVSYRPAIMDSLAGGGGPWANKLLLNAIYFSGALYSDRPCLRTDGDPSSVGARFYTRFRQLLADEIDKPRIPTAVALLLASATLVSQGRSSAGWNLSGTAYRMIIDMGCHLALGPDYQSKSAQDYGQTLRRDLEQEMRKRLYWSAFITDATQALYLGRPSMFASAEARVPMAFLDTFEELEEWTPYVDPQSPAVPPPPYVAQPAHAESTFTCLARLFQISTRITELYGIHAMRCTSAELRDRKEAIARELDHWCAALPDHLKFDPEGPVIPPPHQITPHTTCHALTILLHRAFLEEGHLRSHCDEAGRRHSEEACIASALAIEKLVRAYHRTFTLRRAPFLLSYAIYSAVIVILRQERHDRGQFTELISFFWTCLSELQHGCNFGLAKPLSVLRDMVHEFQVSVQEGVQGIDQLTRLDETFFPPDVSQHFGDPASEPNTANDVPWFQDQFSPMDQQDQTLGVSPGLLASLNQLDNDITQDTLYGLFAPQHTFP